MRTSEEKTAIVNAYRTARQHGMTQDAFAYSIGISARTLRAYIKDHKSIAAPVEGQLQQKLDAIQRRLDRLESLLAESDILERPDHAARQPLSTVAPCNPFTAVPVTGMSHPGDHAEANHAAVGAVQEPGSTFHQVPSGPALTLSPAPEEAHRVVPGSPSPESEPSQRRFFWNVD